MAGGANVGVAGVRNGPQSGRKANGLAFRMTNARSHSGGQIPSGQGPASRRENALNGMRAGQEHWRRRAAFRIQKKAPPCVSFPGKPGWPRCAGNANHALVRTKGFRHETAKANGRGMLAPKWASRLSRHGSPGSPHSLRSCSDPRMTDALVPSQALIPSLFALVVLSTIANVRVWRQRPFLVILVPEAAKPRRVTGIHAMTVAKRISVQDVRGGNAGPGQRAGWKIPPPRCARHLSPLRGGEGSPSVWAESRRWLHRAEAARTDAASQNLGSSPPQSGGEVAAKRPERG